MRPPNPLVRRASRLVPRRPAVLVCSGVGRGVVALLSRGHRDDGCRSWPTRQGDPAGGWCRLTEPSPLAERPAQRATRGRVRSRRGRCAGSSGSASSTQAAKAAETMSRSARSRSGSSDGCAARESWAHAARTGNAGSARWTGCQHAAAGPPVAAHSAGSAAMSMPGLNIWIRLPHNLCPGRDSAVFDSEHVAVGGHDPRCGLSGEGLFGLTMRTGISGMIGPHLLIGARECVVDDTRASVCVNAGDRARIGC